MINYIIRLLIDICCNKALKYHNKSVFLKEEKELYIYSLGHNFVEKEKWLKRIKKLEKLINKD